MRFIGLLTHWQKQAGLFVSQDDDFIYLFRQGDNGNNPKCLGVFLYEIATVKEIRDTADTYLNERTINEGAAVGIKHR